MLNISYQSTKARIPEAEFKSISNLKTIYAQDYQLLIKVMVGLFVFFLITLMLPWTQNVRSKGTVIALQPDQRPQTVQSVIAGRIEQWYVQEGQFVKKGDTIIHISEVKDDYFDPDLLKNTQLQLDAKTFSKMSYEEKVNALNTQLKALEQNLQLKLSQTKNKIIQANLKIQSDSIDLQAAVTNMEVAKEQYLRVKSLYDEGLRSLTDLENRNVKLQEAQAKMISQENKLLTSRNELLNAKIELNSIDAEYRDKIAKANSEKYSALSGKFDTDATISKLENQFNNYKIRNDLYYILAPQDGYITQAIQSGIGETIKEGEGIASIMPAKYDLAIEMYIRPIDLPLFEYGQKVMIQFDGWPAVIFSGWPGISFGTYEGKVLAMDNFISDNNLYRVLVTPSNESHEWPKQLRVGAGVKTITLLKTVQVGYEMWRQINGFPPDYYKKGKSEQTDEK
jgi:membrane fusion protein, adhesin transport system